MSKQNHPLSLNPLSIDNITTPTEQTRRKRLKVLSACNECRRKKTKCNGENPCTSCLKSNVECKYSNNNAKKVTSSQYYNKSRPAIAPITPRHSTPSHSLPPPPLPPLSLPQPQYTSQSHNLTQQKPIGDVNKALWNTVQSIEGRLGTIENILQLLLSQQQQSTVVNYNNTNAEERHQYPSGPDDHNRASALKYFPRSSSTSEEYQIKPPSSSTSQYYHSDDTSSVCSSIVSPKITAIQSLLNNDLITKPTYYKPTIQNNDYF